MKKREERDVTKAALRELDVRPSKQRGQNFAVESKVVDGILSLIGEQKLANVVEIGGGLGALTEHLVQRSERLTVIEIEPKFAEHLTEKYPAISVIVGDARQVDISAIGEKLTVFGNLPYVFSTEIIFHLIEHRAHIDRALLLLQREFVQRLKAQPGGRDFGSLSVAVQLWADVTGGAVVPGDAFFPPTKVESQVVELKFRSTPRIELEDPKHFEQVVRGSFSQRRKTLLNSLTAYGKWSKDQIAAACIAASIDPGRRAETLSIEEFARLARALPSTGRVP